MITTTDSIKIILNDKEAFQGMVRTFNLSTNNGADTELRVRLIQEEAQEFIDAVAEEDVVEAIDAMCDILYVTYGAADVFDMDLDTVEAEKTPAGPAIRWADLHREISDFEGAINDVVISIRHRATPLGRDRCRIELEEFTQSIWECGAEALGVDLRPFFREVHRTNMHKLTGPKREDGKQLKPEGWKPPRLKTMYERIQQGLPPVCDVLSKNNATHSYSTENRLEHPEGGFCCKVCGGLFVNIELDIKEERRRGI